MSQLRNILRVAQVPRDQTSHCEPSSERGGLAPAAEIRSQCSNELPETQQDGACQCSLHRPGTGGACCKEMTGGSTPTDRGRSSHPAHSYLGGSQSRWRLRLGMLRLESKCTGCFLRLPHCSLRTTREWQVCLWLQVFSLQTWPCQVSPFPVRWVCHVRKHGSQLLAIWTQNSSHLCLELGCFSPRICSSLKEDASQECSQLFQASPVKVQKQGCPEGRGIALCLHPLPEI